MKKMMACFSLIVGIILTASVASATVETDLYDECAKNTVAEVAHPDLTVNDYMTAVGVACQSKLVDAMVALQLPMDKALANYILAFSVAEQILAMTHFMADGWESCEMELQEVAADAPVCI